MRRFAIGDIHGCMKSLRTLIEMIAPEPDDELIFLGDYVDRGPDSRDVVDQLIELRDRCQMVALLGNHEIMMLGAVGGLDPSHWLANGGLATLSCYGGTISRVPADHLAFLKSLRPFYETNREIFVHACYDANLAMSEQREELLYWTHLGPFLPPPHSSGKRVFVGHTPQAQGNVLDLGYLVCLDTYCFGRGYLTAMNLDTYELTQVDYFGHARRPDRSELFRWLGKKFAQLSSRLRGAPSADQPGDSADQSGESHRAENEDSEQSQQLQQNGVP